MNEGFGFGGGSIPDLDSEITGSGTINRIPVFTGATSIGNSYLLQDNNGVLINNGKLFSSANNAVQMDFGSGLYFNVFANGGGDIYADATNAQLAFGRNQIIVKPIEAYMVVPTIDGVVGITDSAAVYANNRIIVSTAQDEIRHLSKIKFDAPVYNFSQLPVSNIPQLNASSNLVAGTWKFTGNDILPVTTGSNIGDATHRIGSIFMASVIDFPTSLTFNSTGAIVFPLGTTVQQPIGVIGMSRFNSTISRFEFYNGTAWKNYVNLDGDIMTGFLTLNADPTTALQAATKQYVDNIILGLWDDRGNYNASGNVYPSSGGSGAAGAIRKGDIWTISVVGILGGTAVALGDTVRALIDAPGQVAANWALAEHDLGYTPVSNVLNSANIFVGNASNVATGVVMSGDITISNSGVTAIGALKVTNAMLAGSIAASKLIGTDIATVGTITAGTWNGTIISGVFGGTGINNGTGTLSFTGNNAYTLTGGGTISMGGFTLTVPATGTAVLGTGLAGQVTYWSGTNNATGSAAFQWDNTNARLNIGGTGSAAGFLFVTSSIAALGTYATDFDPAIVLARSFDATITTNGHGFVDASIFKRNTANFGHNAFTDNTQIVGTVNYNHHSSFQSQFNYNGTGILTTLYDFAGTPVINSGTVTNRYGVYFTDGQGAGTITNQFAFYVPTITKGATANWAFYTVGADSYLGGNNNYFGNNTTQTILGRFAAASGEIPIGNYLGSNSVNGSFTLVNSGASTSSSTVIAYWNGTQYYSAFEIAHVASGFGNAKILKSGGTLTIGATVTNFGSVANQTGTYQGFAGSGDIPVGAFMTSTGATSSLSFLPSNGTSTTSQLVLAYYNGITYKSALEYANTLAGAAATIYLLKGGGILSFGEGTNLSFGTVTGSKIGTSTTQLIGVYGAAPIAQRSGAAQAAVATTASTQATPFGYTTAAQADGIVTLLNELRAWAVAQGWIKGSA